MQIHTTFEIFYSQDQYVTISSKTFVANSPNLNVKQFFENVVIDNFNYINTGFIEDAFKILSEKIKPTINQTTKIQNETKIIRKNQNI